MCRYEAKHKAEVAARPDAAAEASRADGDDSSSDEDDGEDDDVRVRRAELLCLWLTGVPYQPFAWSNRSIGCYLFLVLAHRVCWTVSPSVLSYGWYGLARSSPCQVQV